MKPHFGTHTNPRRPKRIIEVCALPAVDKSARPYQTIEQLSQLRDFITHAKPERYSEHIVEHSVEVDPPMFGPNRLEVMVSAEKAEQAVMDVEQFAEQLHKAVRPKVTDIWFGVSALRGVFGYASSTSKIKT